MISLEQSLNCFANFSDHFQENVRFETTKVLKIYFGQVALPFAVIGLAITTIFILAVCEAIKKRKVSRKSYIFIVNRSIGDIFTCLAAIVNAVYILSQNEPSRHVVNFIDTFFVSCFWSAMISYVSVSFLKLYAVARPLKYRKNVTMQKCIGLVAINWILLLVVLVPIFGVRVVAKTESITDWFGCSQRPCYWSRYRRRIITMCIIYVLTIVCFIFTVVYLNRVRKFRSSFLPKTDSSNSRCSKITPATISMFKLTINFLTFAVFNSITVVWGVIYISHSDHCYFEINAAKMMTILSFVRLSLIFRIFVDPIVSFFIDSQIRQSIFDLFGIKNGFKISDSQRSVQKIVIQENSSGLEMFKAK